MNAFADPVPFAALRLALATVLAAAAWHKARDLDAFAQVVADYRLLPASVARVAAVSIAGFEVALALGLLLALAPAAFAAAALLAAYGAGMSINLVRGRRDIDCGCSGPAARQPLSSALVVRNGVLVLCALAAGLAPVAGRTPVWLDTLSAVSSAAVLVLVYACANQWIANRSGAEWLREEPA